MGLEVLGVSTVDGFDVVSVDDLGGSLTAFSNGCSVTELDLPLGLEIEEADFSGELVLLTFSLRTCSNGSSSEW